MLKSLAITSLVVLAAAGCGAEADLLVEPASASEGAMVLPPPEPFRGGPMLRPGVDLPKGQALTSANGRFRAVYEEGGDFAVYDGDVRLWSAGTDGEPSTRLAFQRDGNIVIYNGSTPIYSTNSQTVVPARLVMQDDGNLVFYTVYGAAQWSTGTYIRR
jgi:hypothetical protein